MNEILWVLANLCTNDPRNPNNLLDCYDEDEKPTPRKDCACDNCFYHRDELALEILRLLDLLKGNPNASNTEEAPPVEAFDPDNAAR